MLSTAAFIDCSSVTSSASVRQPASVSSAIDSGCRALAYTVHPERASASAVARPMPDEQPVMSTALDGSGIGAAYAFAAPAREVLSLHDHHLARHPPRRPERPRARVHRPETSASDRLRASGGGRRASLRHARSLDR